PKRVVLVDPGVVARFDASGFTLEARTRIAIERPTLGAVVAGRGRTVERALALAAIEAHQAAVRGRAPDDAVLVDVAAADAVALLRHVVDFGQFRLRIVTQEARRAAEHADGVPDRAVGRMWHHGVRARAPGDALVLGGIGRSVRLDEVVELAVAVGVGRGRRPPLAFRGCTGLVERLGVEPARDLPGAAEPERVVRVVAELRMVGAEAKVDEAVLHRLRIEHRRL